MPRETADQLKARAKKISKALRAEYGHIGCALHHRNPFELIIATILSAQSTDVGVNKVTPELFKQYPTPAKLAAADPGAVEKIIFTTGFYRQKAKSIQGAARAIEEQFGGRVPKEMDELTTLPGVGRKTANVVRGTAFGLPAIFVDTHFKRLVGRLELTTQTDPEKIEKVMMALLAPGEWTDFAHSIIWHGRKVCHARKPDCANCLVLKLCPTGQKLMNENK